jgi:hypothetical protein
MKRMATLLLAATGILTTGKALADCAADATVADVRAAHARGQQREKAGDARGALGAYVTAQQYTCDPNPVEADAARRAAALAKPLADAAKARGDHAAAFELYQMGGHFAAADSELLGWAAAQPDDPALYGRVRQHFSYRAEPAFAANEKLRLQVTGTYQPDPRHLALVKAMPVHGVERALADEATAFDERYLTAYQALIRSRPEAITDFAALQHFTARAQAFQAQYPRDALRDSLQALQRVQAWERETEPGIAATLAKHRSERATGRVALLTGKYADTPKLFESAVDYLGLVAGDSAAREPALRQVRQQAEQLGDKAAQRQSIELAIEYYGIARADSKAERLRVQRQALAQQQMQPAIEAMQRDAAAIQAQFADPQKVAEMKRQALEAQRALQAGAQNRGNTSARKSTETRRTTDAMAADLGM